jgi:replicative DNA helicase
MAELRDGSRDALNRWTQAQAAVIGAMLLDERCIGDVLQATTSEMFSDSTLRHIYEAARQLFLNRQPVDPVTVSNACGGAGSAYVKTIADCMAITPTAANVLEYAAVCRECLLMSRYREAAYAILDSPSAAACAAVWEKLGREVMGAKRVRCVSLSEAVNRYLDRMNDDSPPETLPLGIPQLDKLLNLGRGKFLILAADSSAGKTALALQFAYHLAAVGKKVGFFSLETDNDTLTDRLMAETQVAGINLPRSKAKALTRADYDNAFIVGQNAERQRLDLIDSIETCDEIRSFTIQKGYEVIVVDYLQLIDADGDKRWDIVTNISMQLHRLAQQLGVTVIGLSQITPPESGGKKARLTMDSLRESRQLKHDADVILLLENCDDFPGGRSLTVAKNKDGRRNQGMKLVFDAEHMTFSYAKRKEPQQVPGQGAAMWDLDEDDGEGGDNPFDK